MIKALLIVIAFPWGDPPRLCRSNEELNYLVAATALERSKRTLKVRLSVVTAPWRGDPPVNGATGDGAAYSTQRCPEQTVADEAMTHECAADPTRDQACRSR